MIDEYSTIGEKFLRKGFWLYFFAFIIAPIGYVIKIIISHDLSVEEIGILYGVMSLMVFLSSFNDFGMTESMNKFIPEYITNNEYDKVKTILFYSFGVQAITGLIIWVLFFFGANFIGEYYFKSDISVHVIQVFSFFFLGYNFFHVFNTFFSAVQNTFLLKVTDFFRMLFILFFVLGVFSLNLGSLNLYSYAWVGGLYFGIIFILLFFYFYYYRKFLYKNKIIFDKNLFFGILKYAIIAFLGIQASSILSQIDMQMIIYFLGNTDAGYYTNYLSIIGIPFMLIGPIFGFLFPVFSQMNAKGEIKEIKQVKSIMIKFSLSVSVAFNILFFIYAKEISYILFGEKFITSGVILEYSILFLIFNFLLQINFNIFSAIGQVKERLKIILIAICFNVVLNYFLLKYIGVAGAALATGIGWVLIWAMSEIKLKEFMVKFDYKYFLKNFLGLGIVGFLLYNLPINLLLTPRMESFFILFLISIFYGLIFIAINFGDFKYFFNEVKRFRNKK